MSSTPFPGGLAAALVLSQTFADVAATLPEDSRLTIIAPNQVGIVAQGLDDGNITDPVEALDPKRNGTGTPGNDTSSEDNVIFWCAKSSSDTQPGSAVINAKTLLDVFMEAGGGETGLYAAQAALNAQPLIPAVNAE